MKKRIVLLLLTAFFYVNSNAQGCSDAGFCSVGNTFARNEDSFKNIFEIGAVYGIGEEDVTILSPYITYTRIFSEKFAMSAKVTSTSANGDLGTRFNIGDIFLTGNYKFTDGDYGKSKWSGILGVKIPFTAGNDKINNVSLPMPYQSSLGTFDLIAGVDLSVKKWDFSTALQIPLSDNKNSYINTLSPNNKFESTNLFERKPDVLFRSGYRFKTENQKFIFKPNLLFIYHLGNDSFVNEFNDRVEIDKSSGLTLNANLISTYKISNKSSLEASIAAPLVIREVRPDGLTRAFTFGLSYKQNF